MGGGGFVGDVIAQAETVVGALTPAVEFVVGIGGAGVGTVGIDLTPVGGGTDLGGGGYVGGGGHAETAVVALTPAVEFAGGINSTGVGFGSAELCPIGRAANLGGGHGDGSDA